MSLSVPPFPLDDEVSLQKMANLLVCAVPEPDRKAASELLVFHILPVKLAGIDTHPRPQRLSVVVYKELARTLTAQAGNMRLHALKLVALDTEFTSLSRDALNLAIARFLVDNAGGLDAEKLERWLNPVILDLRMLPGEELTEQANEVRGALESWKQRVTSAYPTEWDKYRVRYLQMQATAACAASACYDEAAGSLLEFLRDAGKEPTELAIG